MHPEITAMLWQARIEEDRRRAAQARRVRQARLARLRAARRG